LWVGNGTQDKESWVGDAGESPTNKKEMPRSDKKAKEQPMEIYKEFRIEAAHRLPHVPDGHKCARLHGHSFRIVLVLDGPLAEPQGWVCDFADLTAAFAPLHAQLDHHYLNEIEGLENPTSENLARWVWQRLSPALPLLSRVTIRETCSAGCSFSGD